MSEEYTGGSVSYYRVRIDNPTSDDVPPYQAECNDIIEALGMNYAEGNAFKALWRRAASRNLGMAKKGYEDGLYDAEKVVFFGQRLVAQESALKAEAPSEKKPIATAEDLMLGAETLSKKLDGKPDWKDAPEWSDVLVRNKESGQYEWAESFNVSAGLTSNLRDTGDFRFSHDFAHYWSFVEPRP